MCVLLFHELMLKVEQQVIADCMSLRRCQGCVSGDYHTRLGTIIVGPETPPIREERVTIYARVLFAECAENLALIKSL
jgi:hypothetical protein